MIECRVFISNNITNQQRRQLPAAKFSTVLEEQQQCGTWNMREKPITSATRITCTQNHAYFYQH